MFRDWKNCYFGHILPLEPRTISQILLPLQVFDSLTGLGHKHTLKLISSKDCNIVTIALEWSWITKSKFWHQIGIDYLLGSYPKIFATIFLYHVINNILNISPQWSNKLTFLDNLLLYLEILPLWNSSFPNEK